MAKAVGWGLIGSTSWGDHTFGPGIVAARGAKLAAVLSSKRAHANAFCRKHGASSGYTNLDEFLADPAVEAVWVAGPTHLHKEHTLAALKAGKHILCEKPMAVTAKDCAAMVQAGARRKLVFGMGYNNRHHPDFRAVHRDWMKGVYGKPVHARIHLVVPAGNTKIGWRADPKKSGGWALGNVGTHLMDVARWYMGDVTETYGHMSSLAWGLKVDDHSLVTMGFKNGGSAVIVAGMGRVMGGTGRLELYGTKGWCVFDSALFGGGGTMTTCIGDSKPRTKSLKPVNTYAKQIEAFSRAVRGGPAFEATARDGWENVKIMEKARGW